MPEREAPLVEIVGRNFYRHTIANQRADAIFFHPSGRLGNQLVIVAQAYPIAAFRQHVGDDAFEFHQLFFGH